MDELNRIKRKSIPPKYTEEWMEWVSNNPEMAEKEYPEMVGALKEMIRETPPYMTATIIERLPNHFAKWNTDIKNCLEATRVKKINTYLELIDLVLNKIVFSSDIENNAVNKIKPELLEMESYLKGLLTKPKKQQKKTSYLWLNNPEKELLELYKLLNKDYNLIASETTFNQFKGVFTGQPIESINPIKWIASKSLNAYFIEQLINKNKLSKVINTDIWEISKYCFYNGTNFSQLIDNYNNSKTGKPKNYNLIDDLLNAL